MPLAVRVLAGPTTRRCLLARAFDASAHCLSGTFRSVAARLVSLSSYGRSL